MNAIRIYQNEGETPFTRRVQLCDVESHIAGNDSNAAEARLLKEFHDAADIPETLGDGAWRKDTSGDDSHGWYVRYIPA